MHIDLLVHMLDHGVMCYLVFFQGKKHWCILGSPYPLCTDLSNPWKNNHVFLHIWMVFILVCTSTTIQVFGQYILWYLPSPTLSNQDFSHFHPPRGIPPSYLMYFLPCKMKGVVHLNPFEFDVFVTLTLKSLLVAFQINICILQFATKPFCFIFLSFDCMMEMFWHAKKMIPIWEKVSIFFFNIGHCSFESFKISQEILFFHSFF